MIIPPIKSQGIKTKIVPAINRIIESAKEPFTGDWYEPFFGTGVVGFNSPIRGSKIVGDTNPHITNQLVSGHYNTVIIGYNKCWKQDVNIGKRNNQSFTSISHLQFVNMIKYKCELEGINVLLTEESYTSKASALDHDFLPDRNTKDPVFSGKQIKRGLYQSGYGYINADVNGALNIMRKVVGDKEPLSVLSADRGFVFNPTKISF